MPTYAEKATARVNVAKELLVRDWKLYGWQPHTMDEYPHWTGIAEHPAWRGVVCCVLISAGDVESYSGRDEIKYISETGESCPKCQGTGVWPGGLTYDQALKNPSAQHMHTYRAESGDTLRLVMFEDIPTVNYFQDGRPKCLFCFGRGYKINQREEYVQTWPTFRASPLGKSWHIERRGKIIALGTMPYECYRYYPQGKVAAEIVDKIEAAVHGGA